MGGWGNGALLPKGSLVIARCLLLVVCLTACGTSSSSDSATGGSNANGSSNDVTGGNGSNGNGSNGGATGTVKLSLKAK